MRAICSGDLHIGRTSTRLPADVDPSEFSCSGCWQRLVECAESEKVDLVLLAGDLVDAGNTRFEGLDSLEKGLKRLSDSGIRTYAVTGNHDCKTLPAIAGQLTGLNFKLLGANGDWEHLEDPTGLRIIGKGYRNSSTNPLADSQIDLPKNEPAVALLHSSLSAADRYAPANVSELSSWSNIYWITGHIHQGVFAGNTPAENVLIPGSPQALSPRESGRHGFCLLDFNSSLPEVVLVSASSIMYENLEVSMEGVQDAMEVPGRIASATLALPIQDYKLISLRVSLTGRTPLYKSMRTIAQQLSKEESLDLGGNIQIDRVTALTLPEIDLDKLAKGEDMPGRLATLILDLDCGNLDRHSVLFNAAEQSCDRIYSARAYTTVKPEKTGEQEDLMPTREQLAGSVRNQAMLLLSELLSQKEQP